MKTPKFKQTLILLTALTAATNASAAERNRLKKVGECSRIVCTKYVNSHNGTSCVKSEVRPLLELFKTSGGKIRVQAYKNPGRVFLEEKPVFDVWTNISTMHLGNLDGKNQDQPRIGMRIDYYYLEDETHPEFPRPDMGAYVLLTGDSSDDEFYNPGAFCTIFEDLGFLPSESYHLED